MLGKPFQLSSNGQRGAGFWTAWYALTLLMVLLVPAYARFRRPLWEVPPSLLPQVLALAVAYLALALFLRLVSGQRGWLSAIAAMVVCSGTVAAFLYFGRDIPSSRLLLLMGGVLGVGLAFLPLVARRPATLFGGALALGVAELVLGRRPADLAEGSTVQQVQTALQAITIARYPNIVAQTGSNGGAIAAFGQGYLLVTGSGEFHRLDWNATRDSLRSARLALTAPLNLDAFYSDFNFEEGAPRLRIRVTDLLVDTVATPTRLIVSHQHWNHEQRCSVIRVSRIAWQPGATGGADSARWETLYETTPCLSVFLPGYDDSETGGKLVRTSDGRLLMSVGEMGISGRVRRLKEVSLAQRRDADYGKILVLDEKGGRKIFSLGHRNPQGLTVDSQGRVWSTEHGPEGGDEINVVVEGGNYGWPLATYGTEYGLDFWPFVTGPNHGAFREPALAFVPALGISDLILVGALFPAWKDDLLIGSLRGKTLYRARVRDDRVLYVEPIVIDREIRDIAVGSDGRIAMWNDEEREVTVLSPAVGVPSGEAVFNARCFYCHVPLRGTNIAAAPPLRGIIGKQVAAAPGFSYSPALRQLKGTWTKERLDTFLLDPGTYAPGTPMNVGQVVDPARRRAVIEYLTRLK